MLRRVTILLAVLLVVSVMLTSVNPRGGSGGGATTTAPAPVVPPGADATAAVRGLLPRDRVVRATVGDLVDLTVRSEQPDSASIDAFGLTKAAGPGAPAHFEFLADRPGRFEVTLGLDEQPVGSVIVRPPSSSPDVAP